MSDTLVGVIVGAVSTGILSLVMFLLNLRKETQDRRRAQAYAAQDALYDSLKDADMYINSIASGRATEVFQECQRKLVISGNRFERCNSRVREDREARHKLWHSHVSRILKFEKFDPEGILELASFLIDYAKLVDVISANLMEVAEAGWFWRWKRRRNPQAIPVWEPSKAEPEEPAA